MKKISVGLLLVFLVSSSLFAQYSDSWSFAGSADTKGEVILVRFNNNIDRMWRVSDGELLYNDKANAFGYASKMLRYKIQLPDWKKRDVKVSNGRMTGHDMSFDSYQIKYGSDEFTRFNVDIDYSFSGITYFDVDNKITLFKENTNGVSTLYNVAHVSSPDFKSRKKYIAMKKILKRSNLEYPYLFEPLTSPSGKYAFLFNYGVMVNLEKNKELWDISHKTGKYYNNYQVAFNADETMVALADMQAEPPSLIIYNVKNGKQESVLVLPETIKQRLNYIRLYPSSDMKSYIAEGKVKNEKIGECWLVRADGSVQQLIIPDIKF